MSERKSNEQRVAPEEDIDLAPEGDQDEAEHSDKGSEEGDESSPEIDTAEEASAESAAGETSANEPRSNNPIIAAFFSVRQRVIDFYHANFRDTTEEHRLTATRDVRTTNASLHRDARRRMGRAMGTITNQPISSTRGGPKRERVKVVTSKTYKPELDRF